MNCRQDRNQLLTRLVILVIALFAACNEQRGIHWIATFAIVALSAVFHRSAWYLHFFEVLSLALAVPLWWWCRWRWVGHRLTWFFSKAFTVSDRLAGRPLRLQLRHRSSDILHREARLRLRL